MQCLLSSNGILKGNLSEFTAQDFLLQNTFVSLHENEGCLLRITSDYHEISVNANKTKETRANKKGVGHGKDA